jgi:hypothetical protein
LLRPYLALENAEDARIGRQFIKDAPVAFRQGDGIIRNNVQRPAGIRQGSGKLLPA